MKVVHCCTYVEPHSAHVRLHKALLEEGIDSKLLSLKENGRIADELYNIREFGRWYSFYQSRAYYLNILRFLFLSKICGLQEGMPYNLGGIGIDISKISVLKEADIIHLHWINDCFLSLKALKRIVRLNKPIVITLHDSWFLTGGCHVLNRCERFSKGCRDCPQLKRNRRLTVRSLKKKKRIFTPAALTAVAPSRWTKGNVEKSPIYQGKRCAIIGNTLDFSVFRPMNSLRKRPEEKGERIKILFGAINSTTTPYKGFNYLKEMLVLLKESRPELAERIELNIFGAQSGDCEEIKLYRHKFWGFIKEEKELARLYNLCDVYLVPSLEDSFNQTVLESSACGTPVVSFRTGGICDIIKHKQTGYLAEYKDARDLLQGLLWVLDSNRDNSIGKAARADVRERFSREKIAGKYIQVYKRLVSDFESR